MYPIVNVVILVPLPTTRTNYPPHPVLRVTMRQKRAKTYKKYMNIYSTVFGFREPYQVLVDSEMCRVAMLYRIEIGHQFQIVLQGQVKPMITQCCIEELYREGPSQQGAVDIAKFFERRKCNHREPIRGADCLLDVVGEGNKHRYVIATQSRNLRETLRRVPGAPLLLLDRSVMVLESPSDATLKTKLKVEEEALRPSILRPSPEALAPVAKKRRGPKAPNPLSMKKKQKVRQEPPPPRKRQVASGLRGVKRGREGAEEVVRASKKAKNDD